MKRAPRWCHERLAWAVDRGADAKRNGLLGALARLFGD
jgi:hypothetical protein